MAKKMILMDPRVLENQNAYTPPDTLRDNLGELDRKLQGILDREDLSIFDQVSLYNQTLKRYMKRLDQYKQKPLGVVDIKPQPQPPIEPVVHKDEVSDKSVQSVPPKTPEETKSYKLRGKKKSKIPTPRWEKWPTE